MFATLKKTQNDNNGKRKQRTGFHTCAVLAYYLTLELSWAILQWCSLCWHLKQRSESRCNTQVTKGKDPSKTFCVSAIAGHPTSKEACKQQKSESVPLGHKGGCPQDLWNKSCFRKISFLAEETQTATMHKTHLLLSFVLIFWTGFLSWSGHHFCGQMHHHF